MMIIREKKYLKFILILLAAVYCLFYITRVGADQKMNYHEKLMSGPRYMNQEKGYESDQSSSVPQILYFTDQLGLQEDQVSKIKDAQLDYRKELIRLTADIKIARLDLRNQLHSEVFNEKKVLAKSNELEKLTGRKIRLNTELMINVLKLLSSEQIKKVRELHSEARKNRRSTTRPYPPMGGIMEGS